MKTKLAVPFVLVFLFACAVNLSNMKPKDIVTVAMDTYTSQFHYHQAKSKLPDLSDKERLDLQDLKEKLIKIKPIIDAANTAISHDLPIQEADRTALTLFVEDILYGN